MIKNFDELIHGEYAMERRDALLMLSHALSSVHGYNAVMDSVKKDGETIIVNGRKYHLNDYNRIYLAGAGKAAGSMAKAMEEIIDFDDAVIITNEDISLKKCRVFHATHPYPSKDNISATEEIVKLFRNAGKDDLIIMLISGGGSSMMCLPIISLNSMIEVTEKLMKAGCNIRELNTVRKHLSMIKGGKLARMTDAKIISLIISDVIGNPVDSIASGPTYGDKTTFRDAMSIMKKYGVENEEAIKVIKKGMEGEIEETPEEVKNADNFIIADINKACMEAKKKAEKLGYKAGIITTSLDGEAVSAGRALAEYAIRAPSRKYVFISGGETVVRVIGNGTGGRNQELVLSAAMEIEGQAMVILSCGSDGKDGNSDAAGAIADGETMKRARNMKMDAGDFLKRNDSYHFFLRLNDAIFTGNTGTNVMDIQIIVKR